jgi:hypothetical protein
VEEEVDGGREGEEEGELKLHMYLLSTLIILKSRPIEIQQATLDEDGVDSLQLHCRSALVFSTLSQAQSSSDFSSRCVRFGGA